jgi:hypothetical protein
MGSGTQIRFSLESLCKLTCKREAKANLTEVLPGSNCCHTFLTIPFIPFIPVP